MTVHSLTHSPSPPQLHIYMQASAKERIVYIPGYPLVNFVLATGIYVYLSHVLFHVTTDLSRFLFPSDRGLMARQAGVAGVGVGGAYALAALVRPLLLA